MKEYKPFKSGKVREVYDAGDSIIMVATDRISAFDHILKNKITQKGQVLTQMSKFWFDLTADIVPNHMISVDNKAMPEFFQQAQFQGQPAVRAAQKEGLGSFHPQSMLQMACKGKPEAGICLTQSPVKG